MARRRVWIIAAACGVLCAACIGLYAQSLEQEYADRRDQALERFGGEQVGVCVAVRDILPGEQLDQTNTEVKPWLVDLLPDGAVESLSSLESATVSSPIYQGEPIVAHRTGNAERQALDVPEGYAAVSVPAQDVSAVGGSVAPGMRVDVYAVSDSGADDIARNVLVLATSASVAGNSPSPQLSWITLAVKPSFVEELIAASKRTDLHFAVSNGAGAASADRGAESAGREAESEVREGGSAGQEGGSPPERAADGKTDRSGLTQGDEGGRADGTTHSAVS